MRISAWIRGIEDFLIWRGRVPDVAELNRRRIARLRARGVRIGEGCFIFTEAFSTEPYLVEIGDQVAVADGVIFATHDPAIWADRARHPDAQILGPIRVGSGTMIGTNSIVLCNTTIGEACIVAPGSVVRGQVPDNSIVHGNPPVILRGKASLLRRKMLAGPNRLDTLRMAEPARERAIRAHFGLDSKR